MTMTLEWAIQHLCRMVKRWRHFRSNGTAVSTDLLSIEALELISDHLETTRWRELSEGKPGPGLYLCRCQSPIDGFVYYRVELATADGFQYAYVTDFMRIIDPEDSNE